MSSGMAMLWRSTESPPNGVQEAHRLTSSRQQLLEQGGLPEARHRRDGATGLGGSDNEFGTEPCALPSVPQPGLARFDHGGEPDFFQRRWHVPDLANDHLARDMQAEARRHRERPLFVDRDCQRPFVRKREANAWLEPRAMPTQQGDRGVV